MFWNEALYWRHDAVYNGTLREGQRDKKKLSRSIKDMESDVWKLVAVDAWNWLSIIFWVLGVPGCLFDSCECVIVYARRASQLLENNDGLMVRRECW